MIIYFIWVVVLAFILPDDWGWLNYLIAPILALALAYLTGLIFGFSSKVDKR